jgi:hypothetical protein
LVCGLRRARDCGECARIQKGGQTIDRDGDGTVNHTRWFGYDGSQIIVQFDRAGSGRVTGQD